jgi:hypothetical protein
MKRILCAMGILFYLAGNSIGGHGQAGTYINYAPTSNANYETRVPPLGFVPPYLPMWQHGGWGTVNGYFPNGPTTDDRAYERMFDPEAKEDMQMLKRLLRSAPYANGFKAIGGLFTPTLKTHRLRGFNVSNALFRDERPEGKRFMIMIDNDVDRETTPDGGICLCGENQRGGPRDSQLGPMLRGHHRGNGSLGCGYHSAFRRHEGSDSG